jgi:hypothetical protein
MTLADIQCLKDHIDKLAEIGTVGEERLIARVLFVKDDDEFNEHDVLYQVASSNQMDQYLHFETSGGYVLYFEEIISVKPAHSLTTNP